MTDQAPLLLVFACGWLLACLWLVLIGRLLNQLSRNDPAAYVALGKPVMRWLWWRWPASARSGAPRVVLQVQGRLDLTTLYSVDAAASIARLARLIALNSPQLEMSLATQRQQQRLRACGVAFVLCLCFVVALAVLGAG